MLLEINEVDQSFRSGFWLKRAQVLQQVTLKVPERSIFGFLGPNGAGKTTLIQLIVGLKRPYKGSVRIRGLDAFTAQARAHVGYLPERPYFYDHLTGDGFLRFFGALSGMTRAKTRSRIDEVLALVGLAHARDRELRRYSKGMLQRIGIAQAILHDPELIVLDEPMSGLDPLGRKEMRELIQGLAAKGHTIFFSSHIIPDVEAMCTEVGLIREGRLVSHGSIGQLLATGPLKTEIAFAGLESGDIRPGGVLERAQSLPDGGFKVEAGDQEEVARVLTHLLARNARILWVQPVRPSLEALLGG
jgi:ABC-2 type transport system ATP-binding protein